MMAAVTGVGACGEQALTPATQNASQGSAAVRAAAPANTCESVARHPFEAGGDNGAVFTADIVGERVIQLCGSELAKRADDPITLTRLARGYAAIKDRAKADALLEQADAQDYPIATYILAMRAQDLPTRRSLFMKARKQFWMDAQADKDGGLIGVAMTDAFDEYGRIETSGWPERLEDAARAGYANTIYRAGIQLLTEQAEHPDDDDMRVVGLLGSNMQRAAAAAGQPYAALLVASGYLHEAGVWSESRNPEDQAGKWGGLRNATRMLKVARKGAAGDSALQASIAEIEEQIIELRDKPTPQERDAQAVVAVLAAVLALAATWPSDPSPAPGQQADYAKEAAREVCEHEAFWAGSSEEAYRDYMVGIVAGGC